MPFTVSHAIVAVPFARTAIPAAAVASGAMAPDLPLFLPVGVSYSATHEVPWFLVTSIPLAFAALVLWLVAVRPAVGFVVPSWIGRRLPPEWAGSPREGWESLWRASGAGSGRRRAGSTLRAALLLLAAFGIGVLTHVFWDGFTHTDRWGTLLFPALNDTVAGSTGASWLHYISSFAGFAALVVWAVLWLRRRDPRPRPDLGSGGRSSRAAAAAAAFWSILSAAFVLATLSAALSIPPIESIAGVVDLAFAWVTQVGAALAVAAVLAGALVQLLLRRP